jgi:hypothetical protein
MIVSLITEFTVSVFDRGVPNEERIVLLVNERLNLGQYGLMIGIRGPAGMAVPIKDNMLWFGDGIVNKGDWIFVYTCPGEPKATTLPNTQEHLYSIHWGRKETILHHHDLVPILFRVDAVIVPQEMETLAKIAP